MFLSPRKTPLVKKDEEKRIRVKNFRKSMTDVKLSLTKI